MHRQLDADSFRPALGEPFALETGDGARLELSLAEIRPLGRGRPGAAREPFALLFSGPAEPVLAQATYPLTHPALGAIEIFLVPVARTPDGIQYEAIFT